MKNQTEKTPVPLSEMTLREHYAGLALQALISKSPFGFAALSESAHKEAARCAFAYANAMMDIKDL